MKGRRAEDLRSLAEDELQRQLRDAEDTLMNLRFQQAIGELENTAQINATRRDVARYQTVIRERQLQQEKV